jgi:hypothetical protein
MLAVADATTWSHKYCIRTKRDNITSDINFVFFFLYIEFKSRLNSINKLKLTLIEFKLISQPIIFASTVIATLK